MKCYVLNTFCLFFIFSWPLQLLWTHYIWSIEIKKRTRECKENNLCAELLDKTVGANFYRFFDIPEQCLPTENYAFLDFILYLFPSHACMFRFSFLFSCILLVSMGLFYAELLKVTMFIPITEFQTSNQG